MDIFFNFDVVTVLFTLSDFDSVKLSPVVHNSGGAANTYVN